MSNAGSDDPFRILDIPYDATPSQVYEAWRETIKRFHPDAAPNASDAMRERLTIETARVNAAYQQLRTDLAGARRKYDPSAPSTPTMARTGMSYEAPAYVPARIPGGDMWRRPITWIVLTILLVAGLALLNAVGTPAPADNPQSSTSLDTPVGWYVGNCLAGTQVVVPVKCTHQHDAKIVAQVGAEEYCPSVTDATVFRNNVYFCIDTDA